VDLTLWAERWNIPKAAMDDFMHKVGIHDQPALPPSMIISEGAVSTNVRLEATKKGLRLWRNNVGAIHTDEGRMIRYGLANDSRRMNLKIKSSDLIGIRPVIIEPHHIGHKIGQFVAREVKRNDWTYKETERERAQLTFLNLVNSFGGDGQFTNGEGSL